MKKIKLIEDLYNKALIKGEAVVNGRYFEGGVYGELEPKYEIYIDENHVILYHWGTMTLNYSKAQNMILQYYGQSNSDRDSINTLLDLLGSDERMRYFPSTGRFLTQSQYEKEEEARNELKKTAGGKLHYF